MTKKLKYLLELLVNESEEFELETKFWGNPAYATFKVVNKGTKPRPPYYENDPEHISPDLCLTSLFINDKEVDLKTLKAKEIEELESKASEKFSDL